MADSEWNRALRTAQRVLENRIAGLRPRESGQPGNMVPDPRESGLRLAVSEISALIEPTESRNES